ncbi:hypothetical protein LEMLEM_LOCUS26506 [Lemmus lemmus]
MSFNSFWRCHGLSRPPSGYLSRTTSAASLDTEEAPSLINILGNRWGAFLVEGRPQDAPGCGNFSLPRHKSPNRASLSPSEKQLGYGDGSPALRAPQIILPQVSWDTQFPSSKTPASSKLPVVLDGGGRTTEDVGWLEGSGMAGMGMSLIVRGPTRCREAGTAYVQRVASGLGLPRGFSGSEPGPGGPGGREVGTWRRLKRVEPRTREELSAPGRRRGRF